MTNKKNIIVAGYPKSGTTWISRLVAELAACPLQGDWGFDHVETLYKEGEKRASLYNCYKTHFTYNEIFSVEEKEVFKIIHVIRDPRDIVISGSHYFDFKNFTQKLLDKVGVTLNKDSIFSISKKEKKKKMIHAVLHGNHLVNQWVSLSWKDHLESFIDKDVLTIKYEDMLTCPQEECHKIVSHLGINIDISYIDDCIKKQSFDKKKKDTSSIKNPHFEKLLRKGSQGYWKDDFTEEEKKRFKTCLFNIPFYN